MSNQDLLNDRVNAASELVYMTEKLEIVEHFRDNYAENKWRGEIAKAMHGIVKDKNGKDLSEASIRRRFEGDRYTKEAKQARTKSEFAQLGQKLPPVSRNPPANGYKVNWKGSFQISGGRKRKGKMRGDGWVHNAKFERTITGPEAMQLASDPNWSTVFLSYFADAGFTENPVSEFTVSSLEISPA